MKVKDLERTANIAWSPKSHHPICLAAGTAAQQLDASFNTNATLEIYELNLSEPGPDMILKSSLASEQRFHKLIWGTHGLGQADKTGTGTIIAGCDSGLIKIYSAAKLLKGDADAMVDKQEKHTGPVSALDFNPFQQNLFATGASDSEIFIWDLKNTSAPMSPGAKSQPSEDVLAVAWNRQVQHILASTFASKCVIWDLRKNEPIIKLTDTVSRIRWKNLAWHPEVATQLCLASEEDHSPVIQLWDLRFATSPLKVLENHQRGVLSVAWCSEDADLLISCGKDNRIVCWNPNSTQPSGGGEVLSEIAKTNQWSFDVAWCPKNPAIIACPNFDGHVSVYSLMGGQTQQIQTTNKIADSFPGMDGYVQAPVLQNTAPVSVDLSKPPKWFRKPVGAKFGFGGKLITFENDKEALAQAQQMAQAGQPMPAVQRTVQVSQVITELELVEKSTQLEQALEYGHFIEYCVNKAEVSNDQHKKYIWHFLKANFENSPRTELLNLLGYRIEDVNEKLSEFVGKTDSLDPLSDTFANLNRLDDFSSLDVCKPRKATEPFQINTGNDTDGLITQAILLNNVEAAVELCLQNKRFADALIIATTGGPDLLAKTQHKYLQQSEGYISSLISAMISEDWGAIINDCDINSWREALAAALTHASDEDLPLLCEQLGNRLATESKNNAKLAQDAQLCYICSGSFDKLVESWSGNALNSTRDLQELIELVTFLQKAVERQGRQVQVNGPLADLLSHYASLLASQGDLKTAISYLGSTQNAKVSALRDRLYVSLGQKPAYAQEIRAQQSRRQSSNRTSFSNYPNTVTPTNPFTPAPSTIPQAQFNQSFNTGLPNAGNQVPAWPTQSTNWSQPPVAYSQPPKAFSPAPPPNVQQPPRPNSALGQPSGGLPSRKYILDPSVTSNAYGNQSYAPPVANFAPLNPAPLMASSGANVAAPLVPTFGGNLNNNLYGQPEIGEPPIPNYTANAPPGWNDPPALNKPLRSHQSPKTQDLSASEPITHPIFGSAPASNNGYGEINAPPTQPYNAGPVPFGHNQPPPPPTMFQPAAVAPVNNNNFGQSFNPNNYNQNAIPSHNAMGQNNFQQHEVVARKAVEPVVKAPIPEEHIHMQTVFEELKNQCIRTANNAQTKRKLEDVGRKLEVLYDSLRDHKLSANTLGSLHQMVQLVQHGDYPGSLNLHTQLVSGADFAQIAGFMPGLKVLLQCALQLQVYLR